MKKFLSMLLTLVMIMAFAAPLGTMSVAAANQRDMEYLDRGVVAVRNGSSVFVSWRLLVSDDPYVGFNVYRTTDGATVKLNGEPLYGGTNFTDTTANLSKNNTYFVKTVMRGVERDTDGSFTLAANSGSQFLTVPVKSGGTIHFVWVGDFNGDGKYDYLLDRLWGETQLLEAYLHDGTYLWTIDLGYNSTNTNNIEPGASTIDVGMWDGATVYDIDCDGYAEVLLRVADGVVYGNGKVHSNKTTNGQDIAVINGMTGALEASAPVPTDMISAGPKACMMAVGYLDGVTPSLICWLKNRNDDKTFNSYMVAYGYVNGQFKQQWKFNNNKGYAEAHNIRIADVDYDGCDEVLHMGYALNGDGSLRYTVDKVVHGDRWYVGSFSNSNNNNEMMGYGIQQDNASGLLEYFYNASTGKLIWTNYAASGTADVARGNVGDVDPNYDGFECWSFQGLYSMSGQQISTSSLYPVLKLWWDGDLLSESFNDGKIEEWDYNNKWTNRVMTTWNVTDCVRSDRGVPMFYGDILGDWREEFIMTSGDYSKLVIFSTTIPTDYRLDCLAQNPCYRNCMTGKGYYQSHMLDYFLGHNMEMPRTESVAVSDEIQDGAVYMIKNANSNLYLDVTGGVAADGTNVQQWGATYPGGSYNNWKLVDAGDGYYQIYSMVGDGNTYVLDVSGTKTANGTNIIIWTNKKNNGQYFKLEDNGDGTYSILTKVTGGASGLDVYDSSTENGGNVVQWKNYGSKNQQWVLELVSAPSKYIEQKVNYTIVGDEGVVASWTKKGEYEVGETLYFFPQGECYIEADGKAYIVNSATEQEYVVARDGETVHDVELELVHKNAVLSDTFADVNANVNDEAAEMLFIGSSGISDAADTDENGNQTVTGEGWSLGNPRIPLLTFNVPEDYVKGGKVKLNVYVATAHSNLGGGNSMKLAAGKVDFTVNESTGYNANNVASLSDLSWSENMFRLPNGTNNVNTWVTIDVTKFVENASGKVTLALYAPRAGAYVVDRENASAGGTYSGMAAYLTVEEPEKLTKEINYKVTDNGKTIAQWTEARGEYSVGDVLYDIEEGEFYFENDGKAYIVKSDAQMYVVEDDGVVTHSVEYEVVNSNAALADTFADVNANVNDSAADMLFAGAAAVADAPDTDADGESTVTGGLNVGNPRVPLLTFNVPEDYEEGKAVKLNVYVAKVNHNFIQDTEGAMKLAVCKVDDNIQESTGYKAADFAYTDNAVWSDNFMTIEANAKAVDQKVDVNDWLTFDVTEFAENASDKITVALYAPTAGVYMVDRENAEKGGAYEGKAAYLEVMDGETIAVTGMEKVTKNGSLVENAESFTIPTDAMVKFYHSTAYMVTNGNETYALTDGVTESIDVEEGSYYAVNLNTEDIIYSKEGFEALEYDAVVKGTIDMDILPLEISDNVIGIAGSGANATWYDQLNIVVGFRPDGTIMAYNGTNLDAETEIKYEAGKMYHLHIEVNTTEATFSAWVTEGSNEYTLALDYAFRQSAPVASALGKLYVSGGWNIGDGKLLAANVEFVNEEINKEVEYVITGENGVVASWVEEYGNCTVGDILYSVPAGEYYYEHDGKAYVVRSEEQAYTVENDGIKTHIVEFELIYDNAVISDSFATVDGASGDESADMLFVASASDSDAPDTDADGNATVTGEGWNLGNPRIPLLTFNVPENYEEGMAVKLNVFVAKAHTHLGKGNSMRIAAAGVDTVVDEGNGYYTADVANLNSLVWSDDAVSYTNNSATIDTWVSIDVTELIENAEDTVTIALYAPRAAVYVVDRESAMHGGRYEGLAAYLEVQEGEIITTEGMEKVTKNGSAVQNAEYFTVPSGTNVKFYSSSAYAVSDGENLYTLTDGATDEIEAVSGEYYAVELISSTEDFEAIEFEPITKGTIDMLLMPYEVTDNVVGITASDSDPTWYDQFNIVVRFKPDGTMDAYNGKVIESFEAVNYEAGKTYRLHIETDVERGTYSAWITDEDGVEYTLALDYAYRASAPEAGDIGKVTLIGGWGIGGEKFAAADIRFAE